MNAGLYKYFLDQKFCINLSVYAILNKRRNLTTITNNNLSRIEENPKTKCAKELKRLKAE